MKNQLLHKVAAIVVTYNRIEFLKRCYNALNEQTLNNSTTIIVNNGSTDGTKEWLASLDDNNLIIINQKNIGGAGGFYTGMKKAYEMEYEWVWLMDDDGMPHKDQLKVLLCMCENNNIMFANALVIDMDKPEQLSFGLTGYGKSVSCFDDIELVKGLINPFNGTFINKKVIDKIGLIKKEMFIWGDEIEYSFRAKYNGFELYTICKALHYHPSSKNTLTKVIPIIFPLDIVIIEKTKSAIFYRNRGYILSTYGSLKNGVSFLCKYSVYFLRKFDFNELAKLYKYYLRGAKNDFTPIEF